MVSSRYSRSRAAARAFQSRRPAGVLQIPAVLSPTRPYCDNHGGPDVSNIESLPYVEAQLNYLGPMIERPRYYAYETAQGEQRSNMTYDPHTMRIHDMRPISSDMSLDTQ